jgi:PAT family beta-lactamase induction signal transducer AmpG
MTDAAPKQRRTWREALADYREKRVLAMLFLGFSAGLPFPLIFATLSRWLSEAQVSLATIGLFSFAGLGYGLKFAWAPLVDHLRLPVLHGALGRRRSWMLLAQLAIAGGIVGMAMSDPKADLWWMALFAVVVGFASATQDIALDAWRIEIAPEALQGALAGAYQLGYRIALFAGGAGVFLLVDAWQADTTYSLAGWRWGYFAMAALMGVGVAATLLVAEPRATRTAAPTSGAGTPLARVLRWLADAVANPFVDFFARNGWIGLVILAFIGCYWMSDRVWGVMAQPFYNDMGFSKTEVALVSKTYGIWVGLAGALIGGAVIGRYGVMRPLLVCAVLVPVTNLLFALLALHGKSLVLLILVISAENFAGGMAGTALIAYLSGLTNTAYTATQYALFTSLMVLPGKFIAGVSGFVVEGVGYPLFFAYTALLGVPAILLLLVLMANGRRLIAASPAAGDKAPSALASS